jgi:hypothetical protein
MRLSVIVACEFSAIVRDEFLELGHDAWSCDVEPCERDSRRHIQADIRTVIGRRWDLLIAHPDCRYMALSGARWESEDPTRRAKRVRAERFAKSLGVGALVQHIPHRLLEQPMSRLSTAWRKPDQIIHPWQFGHKKNKTTWLWLRGLPLLVPTKIVGPMPKNASKAQKRSWNEVHHAPPGLERERDRSRTFEGIARAIARQYTEALA